MRMTHSKGGIWAIFSLLPQIGFLFYHKWTHNSSNYRVFSCPPSPCPSQLAPCRTLGGETGTGLGFHTVPPLPFTTTDSPYNLPYLVSTTADCVTQTRFQQWSTNEHGRLESVAVIFHPNQAKGRSQAGVPHGHFFFEYVAAVIYRVCLQGEVKLHAIIKAVCIETRGCVVIKHILENFDNLRLLKIISQPV